MIKKFIKKPEYVQALEYIENDRETVFELCGGKAEFIIPSNTGQLTLFVHCPLGPKKVSPGDYIVKDEVGNFERYASGEFKERYFSVTKHDIQ